MKISVVTPTKAFLTEYTEEELSSLRKQLTYTNKSVQFQLKKHSLNHFWRSRNQESWQLHKDNLQKQLKPCLLFEEDGKFFIRPGSVPWLTGLDIGVDNQVVYPKPKKVPWFRPLPFELHPEQDFSCKALIEERHGNVNLTTGFGKSAIILKLCHELGLNTCIVVPSKSIFEELSDKFEYHFGKGKIGYFGAGKKKFQDKKFIISTGDSLANIVPDSEEWKFFSNLDVLIVDESHEFAAESLEAVCHGVLANIKIRHFFSATQLRNDGSGPLLHSIIGKTVCTVTTAEAIAKGYIAPHEFRIIATESSNPSFESTDAIELKREHLLRNINIANFCAKLCNATAALGQGTLVLVEELSQIAMLVPLLKVPYVVAHSEKRKERLEELKLEKVDNKESVEKFNKNEAKVLVGTSCVSTGVNMFNTHNVVNWVGGSSPIKTKQGAVGRAVRFGKSNPWASKCLPKEKAVIYDFDLEDQYVLSKHLESRLECYRESGQNLIKYVRLK